MTTKNDTPTSQGRQPSFAAIIPIIVFLVTYLLTSIIERDFYKMPVLVAFMLACTVAIGMTRGCSLNRRIELFTGGIANGNIMIMIVIFILAGCFSSAAKAMGAVDATVNAVLSVLPGSMVPAGLFVTACFVSMAMGTSVGTIVAIMPVAAGIADSIDLSTGMIAGCIVGGAMFGDNLSFISDTTIIASRTQGCDMRDKFRANFRIVAPVALVSLVVYVLIGLDNQPVNYLTHRVEWFKMLPYLIVIVCAVAGINVFAVLTVGIAATAVCGIGTGSSDVWQWVGALQSGAIGMGELIIVSLLAGGLLELIRHNGGVDWIIARLSALATSRKAAEACMAGLICITNLCTANNTIALVMAGPLAKPIAHRYAIEPRRAASLLDIFSCLTQGLIPYGAQMLIASELAGVSPLEIIPFSFYTILIGFAGALSIATGRPRA